MPVVESWACLGQDWKLDEVSCLFSPGVDRARNISLVQTPSLGTSLQRSQWLPLFILQPEKDSLLTSIIFLDKHISFLSQFSGDDPWICDTNSNNSFFLYGDFSWTGLDRKGESQRGPLSTRQQALALELVRSPRAPLLPPVHQWWPSRPGLCRKSCAPGEGGAVWGPVSVLGKTRGAWLRPHLFSSSYCLLPVTLAPPRQGLTVIAFTW